MRRTLLALLATGAALYLLVVSANRSADAVEAGKGTVQASPAVSDAAALEQKRQQLAEKEAALQAKEEALKKLSATLDARLAELNAAKKGLEESLVTKKKQDGERYKKMIKIYKGLKAEQAGALLNKLDDKLVIEMLNQMDQKTAVKLIPFLTQPRVLEWTRLNLSGR